MKIELIYPRWKKLEGQTTFHLPPHGPVVMAAALPPGVELDFLDENVDPRDALAACEGCDLVCISMMLTSQVKRGWALADQLRARGLRVLFGGIASMLHAEETLAHADALFLGEVEGRLGAVLEDLAHGRLQKVYNFMQAHPPIELVGPARRSILRDELYHHKGVRMVDLFHASRGCRFKCYPCAVAYLGGRSFRPRPMARVAEELAAIPNGRLFVVDNSLAQDKEWEKELFRTMIPFKKTWCSHTIEDDDEVLALAAQAGAWYVYQAVFDTSDFIRQRVKRYHDHGIAVEGTVLLGLDDQTEDSIRRLIDFLLEIDLDLAEFTVLTPFPHTKCRDDLRKQKRILSDDWDRYTAGEVVFQPKHMSPARLQELYHLAWETFYRDEPQSMKMMKLLQRAVARERALGTYRGRRRDLVRQSFGRELTDEERGV
ncbi:MAG TPA: radical SAM protein [Myxococcota bacterium]|nr:radical SAM protein [Myxococcota bacterium]HRY92828.1 radical SAM protein [Myxococcota bacterium]HSA24326.1 radical SAM protein [Myxococcota bacterium]